MRIKKELKIDFLDFWPNFIKKDNFFFNMLQTEYIVNIDSNNPDLVIFSNNFKKENEIQKYKNSKIPKLFFTGENSQPDFTVADYSFSFNPNTDERNLYFPLWILYINWFNKKYNKNRDQAFLIPEKNLIKFGTETYIPKKFCSFISGNPKATFRNSFVTQLQGYKKVGCGGTILRNTLFPARGRGDQIGKINFLKKYKFNVCFENSSNIGYNTEKILHPLAYNIIPIYWGDPNISNIFNPKAFLNYHDFETTEEFILEIKKIDSNDDLYLNMINQPVFKNNTIPLEYQPKTALKFINNILETRG